jgi:hypothetical protein
MSDTEKLAIMIFGAVLAIAGLIMLFRGGKESRNVIKAFGAEFELSSSGVVVFLVGAALFVAPFFIASDRIAQTASPAPKVGAKSDVPKLPDATAAKTTPKTETAEVEPNSAMNNATAIAMGSMVQGQLTRKDVDWFSFRTSSHYKHDVRLRVEVTSNDAQLTLRVYDADKKKEIEEFLAFQLVHDMKFIGAPDTTYFIEMENRPDWSATGYSLMLSEN